MTDNDERLERFARAGGWTLDLRWRINNRDCWHRPGCKHPENMGQCSCIPAELPDFRTNLQACFDVANVAFPEGWGLDVYIDDAGKRLYAVYFIKRGWEFAKVNTQSWEQPQDAIIDAVIAAGEQNETP